MTQTRAPHTGIDEVDRTFRAMASDVNLRVVGPTWRAGAALTAAEEVFRRIEASCTRFDPTSALMVANADPQAWHVVPPECYQAIAEAAAAHHLTGGLFDPRCLRTLEAWGYDRSLPFAAGPVSLDLPALPTPATAADPWRPGLDPATSAVCLGGDPIDLGGIGKGLAVRMAADELRHAGEAVLVEAGGDCHLLGNGPEGDGWIVAVEDPQGSDQPAAVVRLADVACATSSVRLRHWQVSGRTVHHLIDPRTGGPARSGLVAVTVVGADAALAEVWSKSLLLAGPTDAAALADRHRLAALWIDGNGRLTCSAQMEPLVVWRPDRED
jgi:thiamine biosynthesis lipoprotein